LDYAASAQALLNLEKRLSRTSKFHGHCLDDGKIENQYFEEGQFKLTELWKVWALRISKCYLRQAKFIKYLKNMILFWITKNLNILAAYYEVAKKLCPKKP